MKNKKYIKTFEDKASELNISDVNPRTFSGEDLHKIPFGLYEIFWKSGGSSLASAGNMHDGVRWIAPVNWTTSDSDESPTGRMDKYADSIERMVLLHEHGG